ncbi:MAG TPA: hypothetical protein VLI39_12350, partial [Sedimentisphaerales bacterium]|nr:hypothetical protein [Sedimentisphaerales bacterium]
SSHGSSNAVATATPSCNDPESNSVSNCRKHKPLVSHALWTAVPFVAAPFLRARQAWCLDSRAMPDVALFHGATAHYAANAVTPAAFPRQNPALLATCEGLRRLHLSPEMVSDHRLEIGAIRSRLLIFEDSPQLSVANQNALRRFVQEGGRVLLTGRAIDATGPRVPHHGAAAGTPGAGGAPAARHSVRQLDLEPRPLAGACARV